MNQTHFFVTAILLIVVLYYWRKRRCAKAVSTAAAAVEVKPAVAAGTPVTEISLTEFDIQQLEGKRAAESLAQTEADVKSVVQILKAMQVVAPQIENISEVMSGNTSDAEEVEIASNAGLNAFAGDAPEMQYKVMALMVERLSKRIQTHPEGSRMLDQAIRGFHRL